MELNQVDSKLLLKAVEQAINRKNAELEQLGIRYMDLIAQKKTWDEQNLIKELAQKLQVLKDLF